jgi:uncharacterized protein (TIGR03437 family)
LIHRLSTTALAAALFAAVCAQPGLAQTAPPVILQIDVADQVLYFEDNADPTKFATDPNVPPRIPIVNFIRTQGIADIVGVNGQKVLGSYSTSYSGFFLRTATPGGQAISDTVRNAVGVITLEILKSDGTPIGTIVGSGLAGGTPPPGAPLANTGGSNMVIIGGTGAFLGARGQIGVVTPPAGVSIQRNASMLEDPANRRRNGGGTQRLIAHLIPMSRPEVTMLPSGPAIAHSSDFSPVSAGKPAAPGEILSLIATGLGPVAPRVDPGQPFPSSPLAAVNSPVEVTVNGKAAEVLGAVGYPGGVDAYQVNFRVPADTARGQANVQVTAAWISGAAVSIRVQ